MLGEYKIKYKNYHGNTLPERYTFAYYEQKGFEGCDVSLEISLREYGLIWGKNKDCTTEGEYYFVYFVNDGEYQKDNGDDVKCKWYDSGWLTPKDVIDKIFNDGWFEWDSFSSHIGYTGTAKEYVDEFIKESMPRMVKDMISYYGCENILGSAYNPFPIFKYGGYNDETF